MVIATGQTALAADVNAPVNAAAASAATAQAAATSAAQLAGSADTHAATALNTANTAEADAAAAKTQAGGLQQQITNTAADRAANKTSIDQHTADIGALTNRIAALEGTTPPAVPNSPTNPTSTAVTPTSVSLSATAPVGGATPTSYKWEYKRSIDTAFVLSTVVTLTGTQSGLAASTSYDFRVSAVNAAGPSPPSPVYTVPTSTATVLVESAHATAATTTTSPPIIDAALNSWTLITGAGGRPDFQIAINGVRQTITGAVTLMKYYNPPGPPVAGTTAHSVAHQNTAGDWFISTGISGSTASFAQITGDPFATAVTPPPTGNAPGPAAAVGYNTQTLGPLVVMGTNWFKNDNASVVTNNADGSVTLAGQSNNYNYGILTGDGHSFGTAFGGGMYIEIDCSWINPLNNAHGWPSLWANSVEGRLIGVAPDWPAGRNAGGGGDAIEWDIMETFSDGWGPTVWDWSIAGQTSIGTTYSPFKDAWNAQGNVKSGPLDGTRRKIGALWVPATTGSQGRIEYYLNGTLIPGMTNHWNLWNSSVPLPLVNGTTADSIMDFQHFTMLAGTGAENPMTVYSISIWQKDGSTNLPPTSVTPPSPPPTGNAPGPAAAVGYNTQTFGPGLILGSRGTPGANWYPQGSGSVSQLANNKLFIQGGSSDFNYEVVTAEPQAGMAGAGNRSFGGGGYFEMLLSMENPGSTGGPRGWPGFWANDMEAQAGGTRGSLAHWPGMPAGYGMWYEPDIMEFQGPNNQYGVQIHQWYSTTDGPDAPLPLPQINIGSANIADPHYYGWLWVPATRTTKGKVAFFFDRVEMSTFIYDYFDRNNPPPGPPVNNNMAGGMDTTPNDDGRHFQLIMGTGDNNSFTVHEVSVWQKDGSKNLFT